MPFLILHKVRGRPAFDIAIRVTIGEEEAWIIPTSGHRAYPYQAWSIDDLCIEGMYDNGGNHYINNELHDNREGWPSLADHYQVNDRKAPSLFPSASALLAALGLGSKPIKRRKL